MWSRQQILNIIPDYIKTGIIQNIKSFNMRPLILEIAKHLIGGRENIESGKYYVLKGVSDSENPDEVIATYYPFISTRQILTYETYNDLPGPLEQTINDVFFYVRNQNILYVRTGPSTYKPFEYLQTPKWRDIVDSGVMNLPPMKRGESISFRIKDSISNDDIPDGSFRLGGLNGILVGYNAVLICIEDSLGGGYVNMNRYLLINNNIQTIVKFIDTETQLPFPGVRNVIFITLDTQESFYYNSTSGEYDLIGEAIKGTLENSTTFIDTNEEVVTPSGDKFYLDIETNKLYRWNGSVYSEVSPEGENEIIWTVNLPSTGISNKLYVRISDNTQWRWQIGGSVQYPVSRWVQLDKIKINDKYYSFDTNPEGAITTAYNVWFDDTTLAPVAQYIGSGNPDGSIISDWKKKGNTILFT